MLGIDDILSVATDKGAVPKSLLYSLQAAAEHVLLELTVPVIIPHLDVVVVRLDIVEIAAAHRKTQRSPDIEEGNFLVIVLRFRLVRDDVAVVHQAYNLLLLDEHKIEGRNHVRHRQRDAPVQQGLQKHLINRHIVRHF